MSPDPVIEAIGLCVLTTVNVGLWTLRVALAAGGRRLAAATVASIEAVLFTLVFSAVVNALDDPLRIGGYALGVGIGTLTGIAVDDRLAVRREVG